jgi:hypothetical protein
MGEKSVCEIAEALESGIEIRDITWVRGTCYKKSTKREGFEADDDTVTLPPVSEIISDKKAYCASFAIQYSNNDHVSGKRLAEVYDNNVIVNMLQ